MGCAWPDDRALWLGSPHTGAARDLGQGRELAGGGRCLAPPADCRGVAACQYAADPRRDGADDCGARLFRKSIHATQPAHGLGAARASAT